MRKAESFVLNSAFSLFCCCFCCRRPRYIYKVLVCAQIRTAWQRLPCDTPRRSAHPVATSARISCNDPSLQRRPTQCGTHPSRGSSPRVSSRAREPPPFLWPLGSSHTRTHQKSRGEKSGAEKLVGDSRQRTQLAKTGSRSTHNSRRGVAKRRLGMAWRHSGRAKDNADGPSSPCRRF